MSVYSVFIATYLYGSFELEQNGLGDEDFTSLCAEVANLGFEQLNLFSGSAAAHFEKSVNDGIEVHILLIRHDGYCFGDREN